MAANERAGAAGGHLDPGHPPPARVATTSDNNEFGNEIARACLGMYARLPKKGKPQAHEWTLLAGVVATFPEEMGMKPMVLSLGTGTKCLGMVWVPYARPSHTCTE